MFNSDIKFISWNTSHESGAWMMLKDIEIADRNVWMVKIDPFIIYFPKHLWNLSLVTKNRPSKHWVDEAILGWGGFATPYSPTGSSLICQEPRNAAVILRNLLCSFFLYCLTKHRPNTRSSSAVRLRLHDVDCGSSASSLSHILRCNYVLKDSPCTSAYVKCGELNSWYKLDRFFTYLD